MCAQHSNGNTKSCSFPSLRRIIAEWWLSAAVLPVELDSNLGTAFWWAFFQFSFHDFWVGCKTWTGILIKSLAENFPGELEPKASNIYYTPTRPTHVVWSLNDFGHFVCATAHTNYGFTAFDLSMMRGRWAKWWRLTGACHMRRKNSLCFIGLFVWPNDEEKGQNKQKSKYFVCPIMVSNFVAQLVNSCFIFDGFLRLLWIDYRHWMWRISWLTARVEFDRTAIDGGCYAACKTIY